MVATKKAKAKRKPMAGQTIESATSRKRAFVEAYLTNGGNASQAAVAAGFSEKTAGAAGSRLLKTVEVSTQLQQRRSELAQKYELTTESVIKSLSQAVHFDPRKMFKVDGSLKAIHELDDDTAATIASVEVDVLKEDGKAVGETVKVKQWDKNAALEKAMKFHGLYEKDNAQQQPVEIVIRF